MKNKYSGIYFIAFLTIISLLLLVAEYIRASGSLLLVAAAALIIAVVYFAINIIKSKETQLQNLNGEVNSIVENFIFTSDSDSTSTDNVVEVLKKNLSQSIESIQAISQGKAVHSFSNLTEGQNQRNKNNMVGELLAMQQKMQAIAEQENERNWTAEGIAKFSEIFREQNKPLAETLERFIIEFSKYTNCNQASIFILDEAEAKLKLASCYAYSRKKYLNQEIAPGEGLVGQVYLEQQSVYLKEVPVNYIRITSGLGDAPPRVVFLVPLKYNEKVLGVMEMASFHEWRPHQKLFIEKIAEIVGSAIASINLNETTVRLLAESRAKEEQLKSQEEELRQNLEEINATQETMQRKSQEAFAQSAKLMAILDAAIDPILTINEKGLIETVNKATLDLFGYSEAELINQNVRILMTEPNQSQHDQYLKNYSTTGTKKIIGKIRKSEGRKKDGTAFPIEIAVNEANLGDRKIFTGILRDISERVRLENEQSQFIEELRAQEEELRQNMEELEATQEEINRQLITISKLKRETDARMAVLDKSTILSESDLFGNILYINDKFKEVSQYSEDELIGQPHKIVRHPDMPKEVFKLLWSTIKTGEVFRGIVKNKKKNGDPYYVDAIISPVLDDEGKPEKYIGARYVIEDVEHAERLLDKQNKNLNGHTK